MRWIWLGLHVFLIVLATAIMRAIAKGLLNKYVNKVSDTKRRWKEALSRAASKPLDRGIWVIGLSFAGNRIYDDVLTKQILSALAETDLIINEAIRDMLTHESADSIYERVGTLRSATLVVLVAWFANRFIKEFQEVVVLPRRDGTESRWDPADLRRSGKNSQGICNHFNRFIDSASLWTSDRRGLGFRRNWWNSCWVCRERFVGKFFWYAHASH